MAMRDYSQDVAKINAMAAGRIGDAFPLGGAQMLSTARPDTEIDVVRSALKQSRELADYVDAIVNRVCGHEPMAPSDEQKDYDPDGVLPQLGAEAQRSMRDMNSAMSALRRLADRFP